MRLYYEQRVTTFTPSKLYAPQGTYTVTDLQLMFLSLSLQQKSDNTVLYLSMLSGIKKS